MKLAIDKESSLALREFSGVLKRSNEDIFISTQNMFSIYETKFDSLGVHKCDFNELIYAIKSYHRKIGNTITDLSEMLIITADKIDRYLASSNYDVINARDNMQTNSKPKMKIIYNTNTGNSAINGTNIRSSSKSDDRSIMIDNFLKWEKSVTNAEKVAISEQTQQDPHIYYSNINGYKRNIEKQLNAGNLKRMELLHSALSKASTPISTVVYRGGDGILGKLDKINDENLVGKIFVDNGFPSTSMSRGLAFQGDTLFIIKLPIGSPAVNVEKISAAGKYEQEVLIDCEQKFHIEKVSKEDGRRIVEMSLVK